VKGASGHFVATIVDQEARPAKHLFSGPAGKSKKQDRARIDTDLYQVSDAVDQSTSLSGPGAGDDQQRAFKGGNGLMLGFVELAAVVDDGRTARRLCTNLSIFPERSKHAPSSSKIQNSSRFKLSETNR
jgi:hypothetical protein